VNDSRAISIACVAIAALLLGAALAALGAFGWPSPGADGPGKEELLLERVIVTAPIWSALLLLGLATIMLPAAEPEGSFRPSDVRRWHESRASSYGIAERRGGRRRTTFRAHARFPGE
jgi:hypothetical protein